MYYAANVSCLSSTDESYALVCISFTKEMHET